MLKKSISLALTAFFVLSGILFSEAFTDVTKKDEAYQAITKLSDYQIINGYEDDSFRPNKTISREEAAAIFVRGSDYYKKNQYPVILDFEGYSDVKPHHWSYHIINDATEKGIMNGVGHGLFEPKRRVTYHEAIKMAICILDMEKEAKRAGGWPKGYVAVAEKEGLLEGIAFEGSQPATRKDIAILLYHTLFKESKLPVILAGKDFYLDMNADKLDQPDETLKSSEGFDWYLYGTETYKDFYAVGVKDGLIVALASSGLGFEFNRFKAGMVMSPAAEIEKTLYMDKNDGYKIHALMMKNLKEPFEGEKMRMLEEEMYCEERLIFHLTNGFRVYQGLRPLAWSQKAWKSARLHSEDMANQNYFAHKGLNGSQPWDRMMAEGIVYTRASENIAGGQENGFKAYDNWVNSSGHRKNMLGDFDYLGVGMSFHPNSIYRLYYTQNLYK